MMILHKDLTCVQRRGTVPRHETKDLHYEEAAVTVGITRATLQAWIKAKKIRPPKPTLEGAKAKRIWTASDLARLRATKERIYWKGQGRPKKKKPEASGTRRCSNTEHAPNQSRLDRRQQWLARFYRKKSHSRPVRVAIYARVSTANNGQDPSMQTRELREYCERRGWKVSGEYVDEGISGTKDSRPELNKLMADAHRRRFDAVVVWRFDRFARSVSHLLRALDLTGDFCTR